MSSPGNSTHAPDSWVPLLLLIVIIPPLAAALTVVGMIAIVSTFALCGFFGSRNLSIPAAAVAVVSTGALWPNTATLAVWPLLYDRYRSAFGKPNTLAEISAIWLNPATDRAEYWALFSGGIVVGMVVLLLKKDRRNRDQATLAGTWSASRRRAPIAYLSAWLIARLPNRLFHFTVLGTEFYRGWPVLVTDRDLSKHCVAAGTVGAGKTEFSLGLMESAICGHHSVTCIDGKGDIEIAERIRAFAQKSGRPFYFFNGVDPTNSDVYQPLAAGSFTSKSDRIVAIRSNWTEPHYETLATGFLQMVFKVLEYEKIKVDLTSLPNYMSTVQLIAMLRRKGHNEPEKLKLAAEVAAQREAEQTAISSLKSEITNIANSALGICFDTEAAAQTGKTIFDLAQARAESAVCYFALPGLLYPKTAGSIARLVLNDCKAVAAGSKKPLLITLEEQSVYPGPQATHLLALGRSSRIQVLTLCQSLSDLRFSSPENGDAAAEQVFGSTNTYAVFQLNSPEDAETAARLMGTNVEKQYTAQTIAGTPTGASSSRKAREFRFHPDEIKFQRVGQAIILDKNRGSVRRVAIRKSKI